MGSTPGTDAHAHPHGSLENVEVAHEHSDISIRGIIWFLAMLVVIVLVTDVAMWGLFKGFDKLEQRDDPFVTPLAAPAGQLPAEPRLQTTPWQDLTQLRADEQKHLDGYGWVDQRGGIGHVPIERAKELLLQRGLPSRANASPDATEGTHVAASGEAAGGRNIRATAPKPAGGGEK
ncbi:MAG: hypothetical protein DMF84_01850 [Acidobacteria bacterium]|nr:MAG: hypothetical protein DMF84_01850 [Acidobacteriota bacterium]